MSEKHQASYDHGRNEARKLMSVWPRSEHRSEQAARTHYRNMILRELADAEARLLLPNPTEWEQERREKNVAYHYGYLQGIEDPVQEG